ncbi:Ig domain-containing protein [Tropheryma whipplei]|uniref:Ig domain-containing protein n=1 Tax=Tropheryma whipplei TaxID=2039 RepID=UPI0009B5FF92
MKAGEGRNHYTATSITYSTQSLPNNFTIDLTHNTWSYGGSGDTNQTSGTVTLTITAYDKSSSSTTRIPVTNTTETSPTTNGGLPKGLTLDTTSGTITGSIDKGVTPGEYKVSFYAFAAPVEARVTAYRLCHRSSNYCVIHIPHMTVIYTMDTKKKSLPTE